MSTADRSKITVIQLETLLMSKLKNMMLQEIRMEL